MFTAVSVMAVSKAASNSSSTTMVARAKRKREDGPEEIVVKKEKIEISHPSHRKVPGRVWTCGAGDTGQLGNGEDVLSQKRPKPVEKIKDVDFVQVSCGGMHTLALTPCGKIYSWGVNDECALGRLAGDSGDMISEYEPGLITANVSDVVFVQICAGDSHSLALASNGDVYGWGLYRDSNGPMGFPSENKNDIEKCCHEPIVLLSTPKDPIVKISSGIDHSCALSRDGVLYSWGCGDVGQLGRVGERPSTRRRLDTQLYPSKVVIRPKKHVKDVFCGGYMAFAILEDDGIVAWGLNNHSQLGVNLGTESCIFSPQLIPSLQNKHIVEISSGQHFVILRSVDNKVYSMGRGDYYQLGHGNADGVDTPTLIRELEDKNPHSIACGESSSFAICEGNVAYAWGNGVSNQTGNSIDEEDVKVPKPIASKLLGEKKIYQVSAGGQHSAFIVDV